MKESITNATTFVVTIAISTVTMLAVLGVDPFMSSPPLMHQTSSEAKY